MIDIVALVILALASYRLTRFLIIDTLIGNWRNKFHTIIVNRAQKNGKLHVFWDKIYELTSCTWCAGFWVSLGLYWAYVWTSPANWNQADLINILAIAGIQGVIHAFEPDE